MGAIIDFPAERVSDRARDTGSPDARCEVVILPVIRIDRYDGDPALRPASGGVSGSKRRRRASRS